MEHRGRHYEDSRGGQLGEIRPVGVPREHVREALRNGG